MSKLFRFVPVMLEGKTLQESAFAKCQPFGLHQIQAFRDDLKLAPAALSSPAAKTLVEHKNRDAAWSEMPEEIASVLRDLQRPRSRIDPL